MRLTLFFLSVSLFAQPSYNLITIIPVTDGTTGAKTTPGRIVFQDKQATTHVFGFTAADSIGADIVYKLWGTDVAGCIVSPGTTNGDGTKNLSIDPTCTGTSVTSPWSVDANNNVFLNVGGYTIKSVTFEDQTPTTGSLTVAFKGGAGQGFDNLLAFIDAAGNFNGGVGPDGSIFGENVNGRQAVVGIAGIGFSETSNLTWSNGLSVDSGTVDIGLCRKSANTIQIFKTGCNSDYGDLFVSNIFPGATTNDIGSSSAGFTHVYATEGLMQQYCIFHLGTCNFRIGLDGITSDYVLVNSVGTVIEDIAGAGPDTLNMSFLPKIDVSYDLGSLTQRWNNGYIDTLHVASCIGCAGINDPGSNGLLSRTASNTVTPRTIIGNSPITVTNGNGVSGNPIIDCPQCPFLNAPNVFFAQNTFNSTTKYTSTLLPVGTVDIGTTSGGFNNIYAALGLFQQYCIYNAGTCVYRLGRNGSTGDFTLVNSISTPLLDIAASGPMTISMTTLPSINLSYDLGGFSNYWNNGYINILHVNSCIGCGGIADPGSNGILVRTFTNVVTPRSIVGNLPITVSNGNGVSGNPTIDCPQCPFISQPNVFFSSNTFNAGIVISLGTNSQLYTGTSGNFYTRPLTGSGISCSGIADGWFAMDISGNNLIGCMGGNRYKVPMLPY